MEVKEVRYGRRLTENLTLKLEINVYVPNFSNVRFTRSSGWLLSLSPFSDIDVQNDRIYKRPLLLDCVPESVSLHLFLLLDGTNPDLTDLEQFEVDENWCLSLVLTCWSEKVKESLIS